MPRYNSFWFITHIILRGGVVFALRSTKKTIYHEMKYLKKIYKY